MYTSIITIGVIIIAIAVLYIVVEIIKATETIDHISTKINNYFDRYEEISKDDTNTIKESIDEGLKGIHTEIKEIIRICNDIENSNSESINNYIEICDDIANINANIVDTKERVEEIKKKIGNKTNTGRRIDKECTHICKCKKDNSITTHKKDDTEVEFDPDKHDLYNLQAGKVYEPKEE